MLLIQICVGSSCHLKGSERLVELFRAELENIDESEITLSGSFCTGKCNRDGVTVMVDDVIHTGLTPETFTSFFESHVMPKLASKK